VAYGMHKQESFLRRFLSHRIWSVLLVVLSVILLFLGHGKDDSLRETRQIISTYTAPVLAALSKPFSMANEAVEDVTKLVSLKEEVDRLRAENEKLHFLKTEASQKEIKLKQLQSFLNLKIDPHIQYLTARVIADLKSPYQDSLRVNVGKANSVQKGYAVIDQNGFLGQVIRADNKASTVMLVSDINSRIPVRLEPGGVSAMLVGQQEGKAELKFLPFGYLMKKGIKIYTSGHGALLPAGIPIGEIKLKDAALHVALYGNLDKTNYVKILGLKDEQRHHVKQAVMKRAPQDASEKEISQNKNMTFLSPHLASLEPNFSLPGENSNSVASGVIPPTAPPVLKKKTVRVKKKKYRSTRYRRYYQWRYRQSLSERRFRAQVFSGGLN